MLYVEDFNNGFTCTNGGWVAVDLTAQPGDYFHVDDYAGLGGSFVPIQGTKSLWCGARAAPADPVLCSYAQLPGYGNSWDQRWRTKNCVTISPDGVLDVAFTMWLDTEAGYDAATLETTTDCTGADDWVVRDGGISDWEGDQTLVINNTYSIGVAPVLVRVRFESDAAWSDQDGLYPTNGALHIDNLQVEGLALEDFEDEAVGARTTQDWQSEPPPGYGSVAGLITGATLLQEDPCVRDMSCVWAFLAGSTATYACGGHAGQTAVPFGNDRGQYMSNRLESPHIALAGSGNAVWFQFSVYRDLPLDNLVFYNWAVRSVVGGCGGNWRQRTSVYYGGGKDWLSAVHQMGDLIDLVNASHIQLALRAFDMCGAWCGIVGTGACHSHAPLFDNVRVYRVDTNGPTWSINDAHQFQDNFAEDGTLTGTVRADMAADIRLASNPVIHPGDSSAVTVSDPVGLANDLVNGGKRVYLYLAIWPEGQVAKSGSALTKNAVRFPFAGTEVIGGTTWSKVRMDQAYSSGGNPITNRYCVDLNDNLFTPGDTVCFFYCAENTLGEKTYAFGSSLQLVTDNLAEAAAEPSEFTCLPAGGWRNLGDVLYVDGMDGRGAQPFWDTAFHAMVGGYDRYVDRYDVRAPSSGVNNRLASRVNFVLVQLLDCYRGIVWDCGDLSVTLGGGPGSLQKTNDYGLLNSFLNDLADGGGVYLSGDDVAQQLIADTSPSAITFRNTYLPYTLTSGNHRPLFGVSPLVTAVPGNCVSGQSFYVGGGCPLLNDFDVMAPVGSTTMEMSYGAPAATNGAVIAKKTINSNSEQVGVGISGFSLIYIQDDDTDGKLDRAEFLAKLGRCISSGGFFPIGGATTPILPSARTSLSQNYPNPFNPTTTISFSLQQRSHVVVAIYDVAGRLVRTLANESLASGPHKREWDGRNQTGALAASGVYFYRLRAADFEQTRKMLLLK